MRWEWEIVEDPEPDPAIEAWLDYMSGLGKIADTYAFYIGAPGPDPAAVAPVKPGTFTEQEG
jgi:hypothetical protein